MLKKRIEDGLMGKYQGLKNGLGRINNYIFGLQKSCYMLLGGASGTRKTSLLDYMVLSALKDAEEQGIELNIFYYSFEIDMMSKQCNWLSQLVFKNYGVNISPEKIKGLGSYRLNAQEKEMVDATIPELEILFSKIRFRFTPIHPTGIYQELWQFADTHGTFEKKPYITKDGEHKEKIVGYTPNNKEAYNLVIMDHIYLMQKGTSSTKEILDKWSEYCIQLRNLCGYSFINVQQFNSGLSSTDRQKFKGVDLSHQQSDFKDSTNPYQDADIVLGLMCPYKLDMDESLGYNLSYFKEDFILLKIIKNRLSADNQCIGLFVNSKTSTFEELPPASEMNLSKYQEYANRRK